MGHILENFYQSIDHAKPGSPADVYSELVKFEGWKSSKSKLYCSHAITTNAFVGTGLYPTDQEIGANCHLAQLMIGQLIADNEVDSRANQILVPSEIGKMEGWNQIDFNIFWYLVVSGVSVENAIQIEKDVHPNQGIADRSLPLDVRKPMYNDLLSQLISLTDKTVVRPVAKLVQVLDTTSLGSAMEKATSNYYGVPAKRVAINSGVKLGSKFSGLQQLMDKGVEVPMASVDSPSQFVLVD